MALVLGLMLTAAAAGLRVSRAAEEEQPEQPKVPSPKTLDLLRAENGIEIDIGLAMPVDLAGDGSWKYEPDAATATERAATPMQVPLSVAVAGKHEAMRTLLLPREKKAIVAFRPANSTKSEDSDYSYLCDYDHGRLEARIDTAGNTPVAVSPDGTMILLSHNQTDLRGNTVLTLCARSGSDLERLVSWSPYGTRFHGDVVWADFVNAQQVITLSSGGTVGLWSVPNVWPKWSAKLDQGAAVALSPNRKYLAAAMGDGVKLLNLADGKVVGGIPAEIDSAYATGFTPDGKRLAVWSADRIRVWDLESAALVQDFGLQRTFSRSLFGPGTLAWVDDSHVLLDGKLLVDLDRRVVCWEFTNVGTTAAVWGGRLWFVEQKSAAPKLCSLALPNREALDAVAKFTPEQTLVLQPGMKVAVEIANNSGSGDENSARQAVVKKLTDNGITVVPESSVRLVGEIFSGETQKIRVRMWNAAGLSMEEQPHEFTPRTVLLRLIAGGEEVWKRGFTAQPSSLIELKENETVDQALQRLTNASVEVLGEYRLPRYLARIPGDNPP